MLLPKQEIIRDKKWTRLLNAYPCTVSGSLTTQYMDVVGHHLTLGRYSRDKASDDHCLPLRQDLHAALHVHQKGEYGFWLENIDRKLMGDLLKAYGEKLYRERET